MKENIKAGKKSGKNCISEQKRKYPRFKTVSWFGQCEAFYVIWNCENKCLESVQTN